MVQIQFYVVFKEGEIIPDWNFLCEVLGVLLKKVFWRKEKIKLGLGDGRIVVYGD